MNAARVDSHAHVDINASHLAHQSVGKQLAITDSIFSTT